MGIKKYVKGQKIDIPRELRPMIEEIIGRREHYEKTAFRQVGEAFGYGAKDIGENQKWMFAIDKENQTAFTFDPAETVEGEPKRINEIPAAQVLDSIARLEASKPSNQIIVRIIELTIPGAEHYTWRLQPAEMTIEIVDKKVMPSAPPIDLSAVQDSGSVQ